MSEHAVGGTRVLAKRRDTFALVGTPVDWQVDGTVVVLVAERANPTDSGFGSTMCAALGAISGKLAQHGMRECVGEVADTWLACWLLLDGFPADAHATVSPVLTALGTGAKTVLVASAEHLVWRNAPPPEPAPRGGA